jgi:adenosyl cobinamide kinase/adenosyl cobinamide phosphate guanylyltransferase
MSRVLKRVAALSDLGIEELDERIASHQADNEQYDWDYINELLDARALLTGGAEDEQDV